MREGRRCILGFLLFVTLVLCSISDVPLVCADAVDEFSVETETEAVIDATGDVQVEEPEPTKEDEDNSAASAEATEQEAAAEAAARQVEAAAAAAKATAEAAAAKAAAEASAVADDVEEVKDEFVGDVTASAQSQAISFVDKVKEVSPAQMKKVAAGALGIWGVAAGAGWVMNNLGGAEA